MKQHLTAPGGAQGAWLAAGRSAAGAVLVTIALSACTGGGSSVPSIFTPTPQTGGASTSDSATPASGASQSAASASASASRSSASASASAASAPASTVAATSASAPAKPAYPTAAPETGGGGTAGLQDSLVFGVGGLAVVAGAGSLAYRRRLARKLKARNTASDSQTDRQPADH